MRISAWMGAGSRVSLASREFLAVDCQLWDYKSY